MTEPSDIIVECTNCSGLGYIDDLEYDDDNDDHYVDNTCPACSGRGYIVVEEEDA